MRRRLLSDPFTREHNLEILFGNLNLNHNNQRDDMEELLEQMNRRFAALSAECAATQTQMAANHEALIRQLTATHQEAIQQLNTEVTVLRDAQAQQQRQQPVPTAVEYRDVVPEFENGNSILLDPYKVLPEFNGDKKTYRSWRTQVCKLMTQIENFPTHPKYVAALTIIRAKITGPASDILINNNTAVNINAIIDRLDFSYADQRPLYVIEAEMTSIKQMSKSLQEFYDAINQALNMVLTKITMTYKEPAEQRSLTAETQSKAIRTFITGLNSALMRTTLYGNMPTTLSQAFAVAQTIQFDNQHLQLDYRMVEQSKNTKKLNDQRPISNPNFRYNTQPSGSNTKPNATPALSPNSKPMPQHKPTPMEIDSSGQFVQKTQFNQFQSKRQGEPSAQYRPQPSFQHVNRNQRMNHVEEADIVSVYDTSMDNNYDAGTQDNQSTISETESVFLDE